MRSTIVLIFMFVTCCLFCQNNARLVSADGKVFKVIINDKVYNRSLQAEVLIEKVKKDTLQVKVEFENGEKHGATLYLVDKGKPCTNKEFNYRIELNDHKLKVSFTGMYEAQSLPNPLIPEIPVTSGTKTVTPIAVKQETAPVVVKQGTNCNTPSSGETISYFSEKLKSLGNDGLRLELTKKIHANSCYTVDQVRSLLGNFEHDRDKFQASKLFYPYCLEKNKYQSLSDIYTYNTTEAEFRAFVDSQKK